MGALPSKAIDILTLHMEEASCRFCLPDVSCQHFNLYSIYLYQKRSFARMYSTKSWVFATNVLNDLSPSVFLDLFEPYT